MDLYLRTGIERFLELCYPLFKKVLPFQVYAYMAVGGINTALNILLFIIFFQWGLPIEGFVVLGYSLASYSVALVLAFMITVPTGFWFSKCFAFKIAGNNGTKTIAQLGKYFIVVLQGLGSDYVLLKLLVEFGDVYPTVAKVLSTAIVLVVNYLLQKHFTFRTNIQH
ncbi:GtrA family protein [Echinicola sp. CAU 1574]|uniref:GtrA family protein n=1 Tax=Echinicola arenosa TaxID=2774144 RepID=A0ABR9AJK7_9BACT|nr:GtrA family protein [Echinicola arenosa]MBD8488981.1 GtrA family protein [Echinicola arenosa]